MPISSAKRYQASHIARLIMQAMNFECCQYFAGKNHSLDDFERMMIRLVESEHSQYSYRNTLVALGENGEVKGICVSYDGKDLHSLRQAFIEAAKDSLDRDFSNMDDETQSGELYIDSLAVEERFRHQGIATSLLEATIDKARQEGIGAVGLLVDKGNPQAEHLYHDVGFRNVGDSTWGGHEMKHLQFILNKT